MLKNVLLPAPFGPMIEVSCPAAKRRRDAFERDEAAELLADPLGTKRFAAHGRAHFRHPCASSVPQMPLGRNSTNSTKIAPTMICQCGVQSETTFSRIRNDRRADEGPEKAARAAEQHHHHDHARGLVVQDVDRHDRQMQRQHAAAEPAQIAPDSMNTISLRALDVIAAGPRALLVLAHCLDHGAERRVRGCATENHNGQCGEGHQHIILVDGVEEIDGEAEQADVDRR